MAFAKLAVYELDGPKHTIKISIDTVPFLAGRVRIALEAIAEAIRLYALHEVLALEAFGLDLVVDIGLEGAGEAGRGTPTVELGDRPARGAVSGGGTPPRAGRARRS